MSDYEWTIEYDPVHGDWVFGRYWWRVDSGKRNHYKYGWARSEKAARKAVDKAIKKLEIDPPVVVAKGNR